MSKTEETDESELDENLKALRKDLIERFSEGRLPSGHDFRTLVEAFALEDDFSAFVSQHADLLDEIEAIVELNKPANALVFEHTLGMEGRVGRYKGGKFDAYSSMKEGEPGKLIPIVNKKLDDGPFCVEVVAHAEDTSKEVGKSLIMLHAMVVRANGRCTITQTHAPNDRLWSFANYGSWGMYAGILGLLALVILNPDFNPLGLPSWVLIPSLHYLWLTFGLALVVLGLSLAADHRLRHSRLVLNWNERDGLVLDTTKVGKDTVEIRYHVTRLY